MEQKYDHKSLEAQCQQKWETEKTYSQDNNPGTVYSIDTPPPTVSGALHIGHIFSYTQADIIARFKRMSGFSVYYPFGFDDNGLPTERFVEKQKNIRAHDLKRSDFIKLCLEATHEVEKDFKDLWQKMGLSIDWDYCYSTIDDRTRAISQYSFIELYKKGYIYRKNEPALYCTVCRTSVAQAELDDKEQSSFFNDIIFKSRGGSDLIIGTTRPELLPSCVALFYHPDDVRFKHLKGTSAKVPLFGHDVPVLEDDLVNPEKGTGLVMCCAFGDKTDIIWIKKHNLAYKLFLGKDGKFNPETKFIGGMKVVDARKTIIEELKNQSLLICQKPISHMVNVHERCKHEIEYYDLTQWFLELLPYKQQLIKAADEINWYPSYMKSRYTNWVENIHWDWCLSRQRFYGIPFPAWHCQECNEILLADQKKLPVDPQEQHYAGNCTSCGSSNIVPDTDIMDTWNTSSLTPYIVLALKENITTEIFEHNNLPMSMRPQAHDIIRTWAFYTIVKTWMHEGKIPWKDIVISGHVLAGKEKISKSKDNNPLAPENLLATYPADAIRYWTASGTLGTDISFSDSQLRIGQRLITKLWNAYKFAGQYLDGQQLQELPQSVEKLGTLNCWILHQATECFKIYSTYFNEQEFSLALATVEKFFWHDFCDNYIELVKDLFTNPSSHDGQLVNATRATLQNICLRILQLYAPFVPHITETIYAHMFNPFTEISSLHQTRFASIQKEHLFAKQAQEMNILLGLIGGLRKIKSENKLSLRTELTQLTIHAATQEALELARSHEQLIQPISKAAQTIYSKDNLETDNLHGAEGSYQAHVRIPL